MTKREIIKILFLALITGNIMGIVLVQIFGELTLLKLIQLNVSLIIIIMFLFIASRMWNKRLKNRDNNSN
jgi:uncharacterized membrane protein YoaK (UPF0700 family)